MAKKEKYSYIDRELSWLKFNYRVLQEAMDKSNPLMERIKFLGIFSNNQDEFFRVRVATIRRLIDLNRDDESGVLQDLMKVMENISTELKYQQNRFEKTYDELLGELRQHNVHKTNEQNLTAKQGEFVRAYFRENVQTHLFPIMLKSLKSANTLVDKSIYLAIELLRSDKPEKNSYAIMEIPTNRVRRFLILPEEDGIKYFMLLDDVIRYCLDEVFVRFKFEEFLAYTFKFTRDSELDIDNDVSKSFLELMIEGLEQRKKGSALRLVYDKKMPAEMLKAIVSKLKIKNNDQLVEGGRYHNFKDYMSFPNFGLHILENPKLKAIRHNDIPPSGSIIKAIRNKDIMLHFPYQSFQYIVDLLREASIDPKVQAIKMTLYRVSKQSNVINALINAARNGKQVTVFLELQARFDEEANIYWSEQLQKNGVKVLSSIPGLKVHSKLILIKRREKDGIRLYANIGTGNFHEGTASVYSDSTLLTCDPNLTNDVEKVFALFVMSFRPQQFDYLVVSPFSTRSFFSKLIDKEIDNACAGREAGCIIKLNNLSDIILINKLYKASNAGVKIQLIIRGICKLVPGIEGMSENIRVISIVDKYLEHARIMVFYNEGEERYFISSADWMVRNLDNRIEVTTPIFDPDIQAELKEILSIQLSDNRKSRVLDKDLKNEYLKDDNKSIRSQEAIYNYFKERHR